MEQNPKNNTLLVRALEKGRSTATPPNLTHRIMERVERRVARKARINNMLLPAGAILGGLVILGMGIWTIRQIVDASTFSLFANSFSGFGRSLRETLTPTDTAAPGDKFLTGLYCYTAAVFLALSLLGEWLRRKYGSGSAHE